jgi:hypothetical protein
LESRSIFLLDHDLFRKPVTTFRDHALRRLRNIGVFSTSARRFIISSVIGCSSNQIGALQPNPTGQTAMITAKPPACHGAIEGARAGGFVAAEPHYYQGRDPYLFDHSRVGVPLAPSAGGPIKVRGRTLVDIAHGTPASNAKYNRVSATVPLAYPLALLIERQNS